MEFLSLFLSIKLLEICLWMFFQLFVLLVFNGNSGTTSNQGKNLKETSNYSLQWKCMITIEDLDFFQIICHTCTANGYPCYFCQFFVVVVMIVRRITLKV